MDIRKLELERLRLYQVLFADVLLDFIRAFAPLDGR